MGALNLTADDGQPLGGDEYLPTGPARGLVVLLHAMMVDRRAFRGASGLPGVLRDAGFAVWVVDLRGRGRSKAQGPWTYDDLVRRDIPAILRAARGRELGPVAVVGHSLGGHTSIAAAAEGAVADAYVLMAAGVWMPQLDANPARRLARGLTMRAFHLASRRGSFPARRVRMGPVDEPFPYVDDLVRFWRRDRWTGRDGFDWGRAARDVRAPVLGVTGRGDRLMAHAVSARRFAELVPGAEFRVVGRDTGLPFDPGHMDLVTDLRARPAWSGVARWLGEVL